MSTLLPSEIAAGKDKAVAPEYQSGPIIQILSPDISVGYAK